jgi:SAM-dependent methyltransferase
MSPHRYSDRGHETLESMSQSLWYNRWTMRKFQEYVHGSILEVGCGIGTFTKELIKHGQTTAIDIDSSCIQRTKKLLQKRARIGFGDIENHTYFFRKQLFDCILCMNVLEHIHHDIKALQHLYTLTKRKGYLVLLIPIHPFLYGSIDSSIGHYRRYKENEIIQSLTQIGYRLTYKKRLNFFGAFGWFLSSRIIKRTTVDSKSIKIFNWFAPFLLPIEDIVEPPFGTSLLVIVQKK